MEAIDGVVRSALAKIDPNSSMAEMESAINIAKNGADALRTRQEARYALSQIRLERLKTWPALVVPVVSLITLAATIFIQALQLSATRQQTEDTQWLDFLKSLRTENSKAISDVTVAPRLRTFIHSKTYSEPASDMARRLLGSLVDQAGFVDLFNTLFPDGTAIKIADLTEVARNLSRTRIDINNRCMALYNSLRQVDPSFSAPTCGAPAVLQAVGKMPPGDNADKMNQTIRDFVAVTAETFETSSVFGKAMKSEFSANFGRPTTPVDMKSVYLFNADFTNVDFRSTNWDGAWFDQVNFNNAIIFPTSYRGFMMQGCNWWEAKVVDPSLLPLLIQYAYPGSLGGQVLIATVPPTKEQYIKKVEELCARSKVSCSIDKILFNSSFTYQPAPLN